MSHRASALLFTLALTAGCKGDPKGEDVAEPTVSIQRADAAWNGAGTFLGIGVLVTDAAGAAATCDQGGLTTTVAWSAAGDQGP